MPEPTFRAVPILRMFDVDKAKEFYVGFLGFIVEWEHQFEPNTPIYMGISRGGMQLHLSEHHGDGTPGSAIFVRTTGLKEFHAEITAKGYKYYRPGIEKTPWNTHCMDVQDPFGNKLSFNEEIA